MSNVENYVKARKEELDNSFEPEPPIRFSVNVDNTTNFRMQHVAKILGETRSSLASQILELAIADAERALGLNPFDYQSKYGKEFLEATGGHFYQDENGFYRVLEGGEKLRIVSPTDEHEVDYSKFGSSKKVK